MNVVDIVLLVVVGGSALFALLRGFSHEILGIAGWVLAALAAIWCLPFMRDFLKPYIDGSDILIDVVGIGSVFIFVLVATLFPIEWVGRWVRASIVGPLDRTLGFLFGVARGVLLCSLCYIGFMVVFGPTEPAFLQQAKTRPLLIWGQNVIYSVVPKELFSLEGNVLSPLDDLQRGQQMFENLRRPQPEANRPSSSQSQTEQDRSGLDRLIGDLN